MSLLIIGSIALDTIETPFCSADEALGGAATYIALTASYFTDSVRLVGIAGDDFPQEGFQLFKERKIDTEGLEIVKGGKTFRWGGKYHYDLNTRDTLFTHLNVFETFNPKIPASYKKSDYVCLGNIDPVLQYNILQQLEKPKFIIGDTMNFWIERKRADLLKVIACMDILVINESEARLLSDEPNLVRAAKKIMGMGAKNLIIKKGEHGALLFTNGSIFVAPALPLENVFDPTGAGDVFAGGIIGYLAKTNDISSNNLKKAVMYGSAMASFCVEKIGVNGLRNLTEEKIQERVKAFRELSQF